MKAKSIVNKTQIKLNHSLIHQLASLNFTKVSSNIEIIQGFRLGALRQRNRTL